MVHRIGQRNSSASATLHLHGLIFFSFLVLCLSRTPILASPEIGTCLSHPNLLITDSIEIAIPIFYYASTPGEISRNF